MEDLKENHKKTLADIHNEIMERGYPNKWPSITLNYNMSCAATLDTKAALRSLEQVLNNRKKIAEAYLSNNEPEDYRVLRQMYENCNNMIEMILGLNEIKQ